MRETSFSCSAHSPGIFKMWFGFFVLSILPEKLKITFSCRNINKINHLWKYLNYKKGRQHFGNAKTRAFNCRILLIKFDLRKNAVNASWNTLYLNVLLDQILTCISCIE